MKSKLALAVMIATLSGTAWAAGATSSSAEEEQLQGMQSGVTEQQHEQEQASGQAQTQEQGTSQNLDSDDIRKVQQALKEAGHDPGNVDGVWGPETQQAVRDFQQAQQLETTGDLNEETIAALGVDISLQEQAKPAESSTEPQPEAGHGASPTESESMESKSPETQSQ